MMANMLGEAGHRYTVFMMGMYDVTVGRLSRCCSSPTRRREIPQGDFI